MMVVLLITLVFGLAFGLVDEEITSFQISIPKAKPTLPDTYVCTPVKLDKSKANHIVGFEPIADKKTAHHMLLYGCKTPGQEDPLYNCGSMTARMEGLSGASQPCGSGPHVIYAWANDAPKLELPEGVAFKVGKDTEIDYLVLQVHYASTEFIPEEGDESGVMVNYTSVPQPKSAGVYYSMTGGRIPAGVETHVEAACTIHTDKDLHPFAFRVHTHELGTAVSGWKVSPHYEWTRLGIKDPQLPQMFYSIENNSTVVKNGDVFASRCTMYNYKGSAVWMGSTRENEMCNFYMMYWVDGKDTLTSKTCVTVGPPLYYWSRYRWLLGGGLINIPEHEASVIEENSV